MTAARDVLRRTERVRDDALTTPVHSERTAAVLGVCLGICFTVSFLTGLYSHVLQHPVSWLPIPSRPVGLYRVTQGLHIATGIAAVPLLLAKLWSVYPKLFVWPPFHSAAHAVERVMLVLLVCGSAFMLFTGVANIERWYPWPFFFTTGHYWVAWITIGALIMHVGAKATTTRRVLRRGGDPVVTRATGTLSRRGFLGAVGAASGALTLTTVGQTFNPLSKLVLFAPRRLDFGSQGVPVNRAAAEAGIANLATNPDYRLVVSGQVEHELALTADDLVRRSTTTAALPIACVEGWSVSATWRGVHVGDLLREAGVVDGRAVHVNVVSLEKGGLYAQSLLNEREAWDDDTLLATHLNGERLDLDHGYPVRLIGPNRPGVLQTKWVSELMVR